MDRPSRQYLRIAHAIGTRIYRVLKKEGIVRGPVRSHHLHAQRPRRCTFSVAAKFRFPPNIPMAACRFNITNWGRKSIVCRSLEKTASCDLNFERGSATSMHGEALTVGRLASAMFRACANSTPPRN